MRAARTCPVCGREFDKPPALSRKDNKSLICPDCGTKEALDAIGMPADKQTEILDIIHKNYTF